MKNRDENTTFIQLSYRIFTILKSFFEIIFNGCWPSMYPPFINRIMLGHSRNRLIFCKTVKMVLYIFSRTSIRYL